jgi:uncharacterized protein YjiS (DUF1127 family)
MTSASLTAFRIERAMTQQPRLDRLGDLPAPVAPEAKGHASSLLASVATRLTAWRRRAKQARDFRGFDQRQLRDLGLNHFDQW